MAALAATSAAAAATTATAGAAVAVYPFPNSRYVLPGAQIAFRGIPAGQIGTVTVVGSRSGAHSGRIAADSDGQGGSFLPDKPFLPGERVTLTTHLSLVGASSGTFSFTIATPGRQPPAMALPQIPAGPNDVQRFRTRGDLRPVGVRVLRNSAPAGGGDIFVAPQFGPVQNGPMLLDPSGRLLWFRPISLRSRQLATDFRTQTLYGKPVLTWWQGTSNSGSGRGVGMIFDASYHQQQVVHAAGGLSMDLHEFLVTPTGQAYFIAVQPVWLPGVHRAVADGIVQEVDLATGLVLFQWNALDHIPLSTSMIYGPRAPGHILDPYHLNSVSITPDGQLLVSARNTSAIYKVDRQSGAVIWTLGGRGSSFRMGSGAATAFQHDAIQQADGTITIFDDGAGPPRVHSSSRAVRVSVNTYTKTASLVRQYGHSPGILADFEGGAQLLPNGDMFIGWGQQPYFSEADAGGHQLFDARFSVGTASYRAYRLPWSAQPPSAPVVALSTGPDGTTTAYGSWNGATTVASWRLLSGESPSVLAPLAARGRSGFETPVSAASGDPYYQLQALSATGAVLAASSVVGASQHLAAYGRSAFVSAGGVGGVPAGCFARRPCRIVVTVTRGSSVLARSSALPVAANSTAVLHFRLSRSAARALESARRLGVQLTLTDSVSHARASVPLTLVAFSSGGPGPRRSSSHQGPLALLGGTDFVSSRGVGGILTGCAAATACHGALTLSSGGTVIARSGVERQGPHTAGYFMFQLSAAGRQLLARAPGHQLAATVTLSGPGGTAGGTVALVSF